MSAGIDRWYPQGYGARPFVGVTTTFRNGIMFVHFRPRNGSEK